MENVKKAMAQLGMVPKLRLGVRLIRSDGKPGGVKSTGPHKVKFLSEPSVVMGKSFEGQSRQEFKIIVEENGKKLRWMVPLLNKEKQPNYLLERLEDVKVGDVRILEMMKHGAANYIDIRGEDEMGVAPDSEDVEEDVEYEDNPEAELAKVLEKESKI